MDLKDFISDTLNQIIDGVIESQKYATQKGAKVNPAGARAEPNTSVVYVHGSGIPPLAQIIEFDLAVTITESGGAKAGVGIFAGALGLGTQAQMESGNVVVNRIRFSLPVRFPQQ